MATEVFRRIVLAVGVILASALVCYAPPYLYSAAPVDWNDKIGGTLDRERDNKRLFKGLVPEDTLNQVDLAPDAKQGLKVYIERETKGRLFEPTSKEWTGVFSALSALRRGEAVSKQWHDRKGRMWENEYYFSDQDRPFNELRDVLKGDKHFTYVLIRDSGSEQYLSVTKRMRQDSMRYAPGQMAYPYRRHGFLCLLATALIYWLLPWPKVRRDSLRYSRPRSAVVPDVLAAVMVGMFFSLPILITSGNDADEGIFSPGWVILTGIMWCFALMFASIWVFSAAYARLSLEFLDNQLRISSWRGVKVVQPSDIELVTAQRIDPQKLNRALVIISMFLSWRAAGVALANSGPEYAISLVTRDGRRHRFPLKGAVGLEQAIGRLQRYGVPIDPSVYDLLELKPTSNELATPFPPLGSGVGAFIAALGFICLFGWLAITAKVYEPLRIDPARIPTEPYSEPKNKTWVPPVSLIQAEEIGLAEIRRLQLRMKELEQIVKTGTPSERQAAARESNELLNQVMRIHERIEKMRKDAGAPD